MCALSPSSREAVVPEAAVSEAAVPEALADQGDAGVDRVV